MNVTSSLKGRLQNTNLPKSKALFPLFEAVVNSIQSLEDASPHNRNNDLITIEIVRNFSQESLIKDGQQNPIIDFNIIDNGVGFNEDNFNSFKTLDTTYKSNRGCRGVGRLLWLKAFEEVAIKSIFLDEKGVSHCREFHLNESEWITKTSLTSESIVHQETKICLKGFKQYYLEKCPKNAETIAVHLLEHCLWYFIRAGSAPRVIIIDGDTRIDLNNVYKQNMLNSSLETVSVRGYSFELIHMKLKADLRKEHFFAYCAANRVVTEEKLSGKVEGLYKTINDEKIGTFVYACYVTADYLDKHVRSERTEFAIAKKPEDCGTIEELSWEEIQEAVSISAAKYLDNYIQEELVKCKERLNEFVDTKAPKYRPLLSHMGEFIFAPGISDTDLELILHKQQAKIEENLLMGGQEILKLGNNESQGDYERRVGKYLAQVSSLKESDLASYVTHRRVILDMLKQCIEINDKGKYANESIIHQLIFPMKSSSDEVDFSSNASNLWLIDERLAFHNYLASDKPLNSMPIIDSCEEKRPDILALNFYDTPLLVSEGQKLPLATITVVEIKRPMRNDAAQGEEKDPIEQALSYVELIRKGNVKTNSGRPIPDSADIPAYCYVICDLTPSVKYRCAMKDLTITNDKMGYFGYNKSFNCYIEVISYNKLLNSAEERSYAFFDKLGLPSTRKH